MRAIHRSLKTGRRCMAMWLLSSTAVIAGADASTGAAASLLFPHFCYFPSSPHLRLRVVTSRRRFLSSILANRNRKHENDPRKHWDDFYKRHHNKFFKDRHYLEKDWGRYFSSSNGFDDRRWSSVDRKVVLEVGCGAGNTLFPLLATFPHIYVHACDFSPQAIALVQSDQAFESDRVNAFDCDITSDDLCNSITPASIDVVTMHLTAQQIFTLSAVSPAKMPFVLQNIRNVLKPGGYVLFRDYGTGDFAEEKLANKDRMISNNFYVRGDGTHAFYFSEDSLTTLFEKESFNILDISVCCRKIVNRSRNVIMDRRWLRATFSNVDRHVAQQQLPN